jgi:CheY-like chemotaxis protein
VTPAANTALARPRLGASILVVDDDPMARRTLARTLRQRGHAVTEAADGEAALARCSGPDPPRIVILDWMMPGLSGCEVCQRLRDMAAGPYFYVILLTAKNRHQDVLGGFAAGADVFMTKPYMPDELLARVGAAERMLAASGGPSALAAALREAEASPGGDVIVRDGPTVGRILFHAGRVAWIHLSSEPGSLAEVLAGAVAPADVSAVMAESAASGRNFAEMLVDWDLIAADELRARILGWLRAKLHAVLALDPALVMFVPQRREHGGDLTYTLSELLPTNTATAAAAPTAPAIPARIWASPRVASVLSGVRSTAGVLAVALFDASRGLCVGIQGTPSDISLMLALSRLSHDESADQHIEELMIIRGRRYHLLGATATPGHYIYLEVDRGAANLGQARVVLRSSAIRCRLPETARPAP